MRVTLACSLFVLASLLVGNPVRAQEVRAPAAVRIQGVVSDSLSGEPLGNAVISVVGLDSTALTDARGRYRLTLPAGTWTLDARRVGFQPRTASVVADTAELTRDFRLLPVPVALAPMVVEAEAENPAMQIMRKAIARKNDLLARIHDYRYDAYVKLSVRNAAKSPDSANAVMLLTETMTTAYWERPDRYLETITARRQTRNVDAANNIVTVGQIVNFNRNRIDLEKYSVVSPTADDALDYYRYRLLDTLEVAGHRAFRLAIEPTSEARPLFVGMIDIADSTFDVLGIEVGVNEAIRFPFVENLTYRQRMRDWGDDRWMPYEIRLTGDVHFGVPLPGIPRRITFEQVVALDHFRFDTGNPPAGIGEYAVVVDPGADDADSAAWEADRRLPLTPVETAAYARIDSLERHPSIGKLIGTGALYVLAASFTRDFFHFTRVEGAYVGAGWTWRELSPDWVLRTKLGYATGSEQWQYAFGVHRRLSERQRLWIGVDVRDEVTARPTMVTPASYDPTWLQLLAKLDPFDYYRERGFSIDARTKLLDHTSLAVTYRDARQATLPVVTDFAFARKDEPVRPNPPIADGHLRSVAAELGFDSRPLIKSKGRDSPLTTLTYTRLTLGVEASAPSVIPSDFDYTRLYGRLAYRGRTLNLGITTVDIFGGVAFGDLPPQRYYTVDYGQGAFFEAGGFNTLNETNFSGDRAAAVVVRHNFDQALFRRSGIPGVRDLPFGLVVHAGAFWTDFRGATTAADSVRTAPSGYSEIGFGVTNLTPFLSPFNFGVYCTWQLSSYDTRGFELRVGIPGF